jgi:hypothetical protein
MGDLLILYMNPIQIQVTNKADQPVALTGQDLLAKKCSDGLEIISTMSDRALKNMAVEDGDLCLIRLQMQTPLDKDIIDVVQTIGYVDGEQKPLKDYDSNGRVQKGIIDIALGIKLSQLSILIGLKGKLIITFFPAEKIAYKN